MNLITVEEEEKYPEIWFTSQERNLEVQSSLCRDNIILGKNLSGTVGYAALVKMTFLLS